MWSQSGWVPAAPPLPSSAAPSQVAGPPLPQYAPPSTNSPQTGRPIAPATPSLIGPVLPPAANINTTTTTPTPGHSAVASTPTGESSTPTDPFNPYAHYTAAQYAALSSEQQLALQQHWQQWQAYQEEYAKWHAQYGEQYKREMAAASMSSAVSGYTSYSNYSVTSYASVPPPVVYTQGPQIQPQPPPPPLANNYQPAPNTLSQFSQPSIPYMPPTQTVTKISGQPQMYIPPPQIPPQQQNQHLQPPPQILHEPLTQQQQQQYPFPHHHLQWQQQASPYVQANYPPGGNNESGKSGPPGSFNTGNNYRGEKDFRSSGFNQGPNKPFKNAANDLSQSGGQDCDATNVTNVNKPNQSNVPLNQTNFGSNAPKQSPMVSDSQNRCGPDTNDNNPDETSSQDNSKGNKQNECDDRDKSGLPTDDKIEDLNSQSHSNHQLQGPFQRVQSGLYQSGRNQSDNHSQLIRFQGQNYQNRSNFGTSDRNNQWSGNHGHQEFNQGSNLVYSQGPYQVPNRGLRQGENQQQNRGMNEYANLGSYYVTAQGQNQSAIRRQSNELDEEAFDRQFKQWEMQFEEWKAANANHPDREMYIRYEQEFERQRTRIIERRDQMRRRKMGQMGYPPPPRNNNESNNCASIKNIVCDALKHANRSQSESQEHGLNQSDSNNLQTKELQKPEVESANLKNQNQNNVSNLHIRGWSKQTQERKRDSNNFIDHIEDGQKNRDAADNLGVNEPAKKSKKSSQKCVNAEKYPWSKGTEPQHRNPEEQNEQNPPPNERGRVSKERSLNEQKDLHSSEVEGKTSGECPENMLTEEGSSATNAAMSSSALSKADDSRKRSSLDTTEAKKSLVPTEIIALDDDEDDTPSTRNTNAPMSGLFKKFEGIPGLDLVDENKSKSINVNSEAIPFASSKEIPSLFDIVVEPPPDMAKNTKQSILDDHFNSSSSSKREEAENANSGLNPEKQPFADITAALNNPNFIKLISDALAKAQGKNPDETNAPIPEQFLQLLPTLVQQAVQQNSGVSNKMHSKQGEQNELNAEEDQMSFAEWQKRQKNVQTQKGSLNTDESVVGNSLDRCNTFSQSYSSNLGAYGPDLIGYRNDFNRSNLDTLGCNFDRGGSNFSGGDYNFQRSNFNSGGVGLEGDSRNYGQNFGGSEPNFNRGGNGLSGGPSNLERNNYNFRESGLTYGGGGSNFGGNGLNVCGNSLSGPRLGGDGFGFGVGGRNQGPTDKNFNGKRINENPFRRGGPDLSFGGGDGGNGRNNFGQNSRNLDGRQTCGNKSPGQNDFNRDYNAMFRPMQVIDYQNQSSSKVIDYDHRPSTATECSTDNASKDFVPMKTFDYGHSSNGNNANMQNRNMTTGNIPGFTGNEKKKRKKKPKFQNTEGQFAVNQNKNNQGTQQQQKQNYAGNNHEQQKQQQQQKTQQQQQNNFTEIGNNRKKSQQSLINSNTEKTSSTNITNQQQQDQQNLLECNDKKNNNKNNKQNRSPPPPPMFSSNESYMQGQKCNSGKSTSIFPSTASANENLEKSMDNVQINLPSIENSNTITIDEILLKPGRFTRPKRICMILRGPPGSGKSYVARCIKEKEVEMGGQNPRILSIDDYFLVENEYDEKCPKTGRKLTKKEMIYEYDKGMEDAYMQSLIKAFKKTVTDQLYDFIIIDCNNNSLRTLNEFYCHAKDNGFVPYIIDLLCDLATCLSTNIHNRSEEDIKEIIKTHKPTPFHYIKLDVGSLLENVVEMEDAEDMVTDSLPPSDATSITTDKVNSDESTVKETSTGADASSTVNADVEEDSNEPEVAPCGFLKSKWEADASSEDLARLDGVSKGKVKRSAATMQDYLQMEDWELPKSSAPGKKRVRWADIEEKREQEKMRAIGFVVGQTDWNRMMDPNAGNRALNKTKYIERVKKWR